MSNTPGYAVRRDGDESRAVVVTPTGDHAWRLDAHHAHLPGRPWSGEFAQRLARGGRQTAWILPEDTVTCSQTRLPRLKRREMVRAVTGWVARQEGGAPDDWTVSWRAFAPPSGEARDSQQVAMVYARRDLLSDQLAAAADVGATPGLMLPASLVLDQFFRAAMSDTADLDVWNLVFLGDRHNVLCVANRDGLLLTRPLPGDLSGGDREEYLDRLATEVDRSVFFARQSAGNLQVDGVFVGGDPELAAQLVAKLDETSNVAGRHWRLDDAVDCGDATLDADDQLLAMAAALATRPAPFNLAPRARRGLLGPLARRRVLVGVGAAAATLVPLLIVGGLLTERAQRQYLEDARLRLADATLRAEEAADVYQRQRMLRAQEEYLARHAGSRHDLGGVLRRLADAAPAEVLFRDLQLNRRDSGVYLHLTGRSSAATIAGAQQAFMVFQDAVADIEALRPLGEPRQLEIGEVDHDGRIRQTVVFTLECRVLQPRGGEEG